MLSGKIIQCVSQKDIRHTTYENSWKWTMSYVMDFIGTFMLTFYIKRKKRKILEAAKGEGGRE